MLVALVVLGVLLGLVLARFLRGLRSRARNRVAGEGEARAEQILSLIHI